MLGDDASMWWRAAVYVAGAACRPNVDLRRLGGRGSVQAEHGD